MVVNISDQKNYFLNCIFDLLLYKTKLLIKQEVLPQNENSSKKKS